ISSLDILPHILFFFQAEDGIRDGHVTGVQTCALPISAWGVPRAAYPVVVSFPLPASAHRPDVEVAAQLRAAGFVRAQIDGETVRSEERRVGKECRARW